MYKRKRHKVIVEMLHLFDNKILEEAKCFFGGGTAISLLLGEYRESVDIDFLCPSADGYRLLRNVVSNTFGNLVVKPLKYLRDVRTDQYKIYTVVELENIPIKIEIVREARIEISGLFDNNLQTPILSREGLFAQKLLANADRGYDRFSWSRDIIDLAFMIDGWGNIPRASWNKAQLAYGNIIPESFAKCIQMIHNDENYLKSCFEKMSIDLKNLNLVKETLIKSIENLEKEGVSFPELYFDKNNNSLLM